MFALQYYKKLKSWNPLEIIKYNFGLEPYNVYNDFSIFNPSNHNLEYHSQMQFKLHDMNRNLYCIKLDKSSSKFLMDTYNELKETNFLPELNEISKVE